MGGLVKNMLDVIIGGWVGQKRNVNLMFCVVTLVWTVPLTRYPIENQNFGAVPKLISNVD